MTHFKSVQKLLLVCTLTLLPLSSSLAQNPAPAPPLPIPTPTSSNDTSVLVSPQTGIDYTPLQKLLAAKQWRKANEKTAEFILRASGREAQGWITPENFKELPCWDLNTIDQLWKQYSNGHFGFTVQFPIFIETGNKPGKLLAIENYEKFGDRIGWRKDGDWIIFKENLNYSEEAPAGHLPFPRQEYQITGARLQYVNLAQRMVDCKLVTYPTPKK